MRRSLLPLCLSGNYSPFVLGCGSWPVRTKDAHFITISVNSSEMVSLRYRFLRVERAALRLGGHHGPMVSSGGIVLIPPGAAMKIHLASDILLSYLAFDVVASRRAYGRRGQLVSVDTVQQPAPREVWGVDLPLIVPPEILPLVLAQWPYIRDHYWRSLRGQLEANLALAKILLALIPVREEIDGNAADTHAVDPDPMQSAIQFGSRAASLSNPPRSRDLAQFAGMSPGQFRSRFRQKMGRSPCEWLLQLRLEQAAIRLEAGWTSNAAAINGGWKSSANFNRAFSKHYGCSPGVWQHRHRALAGS